MSQPSKPRVISYIPPKASRRVYKNDNALPRLHGNIDGSLLNTVIENEPMIPPASPGAYLIDRLNDMCLEKDTPVSIKSERKAAKLERKAARLALKKTQQSVPNGSNTSMECNPTLYDDSVDPYSSAWDPMRMAIQLCINDMRLVPNDAKENVTKVAIDFGIKEPHDIPILLQRLQDIYGAMHHAVTLWIKHWDTMQLLIGNRLETLEVHLLTLLHQRGSSATSLSVGHQFAFFCNPIGKDFVLTKHLGTLVIPQAESKSMIRSEDAVPMPVITKYIDTLEYERTRIFEKDPRDVVTNLTLYCEDGRNQYSINGVFHVDNITPDRVPLPKLPCRLLSSFAIKFQPMTAPLPEYQGKRRIGIYRLSHYDPHEGRDSCKALKEFFNACDELRGRDKGLVIDFVDPLDENKDYTLLIHIHKMCSVQAHLYPKLECFKQGKAARLVDGCWLYC